MQDITKNIINVPASEYHEASRSGHYMSSHLLADFRESPLLYRKKTTGQIPGIETPALTLGRAVHCLVLEGRHAFDQQYMVCDGPINSKTGEPYGKTTKAYAAWLASQDREIVSPKDYDFMLKLQKSVWMHDAASLLLDEGFAEGVIRTELEGVACQIRMDWFSPIYGLIDLKTCDSLRWFESDCKRYGYILQMAFYQQVILAATGVKVPVHLIAVEKNEPYSTGVWEISDDVLDQAAKINAAALKRYRECLLSNFWPTGYEAVRVISNL